MAARTVFLSGVLLVLAIFPAGAAETTEAVYGADVSGGSTPGEAVPGSRPARLFEPRIDAGVSEGTRERIASSFAVAVDRVREFPECRAMFAELGADGIETVSRMYFTPIGIHGAKANVCRGVVAYTVVDGGPTTWLCREFSRLTERKAAKVIIHEALHHAGLTERPGDPEGMTPAGIDSMVAKRCGL